MQPDPLPNPMPEYLHTIARQYQDMGAADLRASLARFVVGTVENVLHMACILRRLEELGDDLASLNTPWLEDLRRVAYGQLVPNALLIGTRHRRLFNAVRSLPLPDQSRVVADEPMPVVVHREGVGPEPRMVPPSKMEDWQIRQVFTKGHIRSEVEQVNYLDNPKRRRGAARNLGVLVDRKHRRLIVSGENIEITAAQMAEYLREFTK